MNLDVHRHVVLVLFTIFNAPMTLILTYDSTIVRVVSGNQLVRLQVLQEQSVFVPVTPIIDK